MSTSFKNLLPNAATNSGFLVFTIALVGLMLVIAGMLQEDDQYLTSSEQKQIETTLVESNNLNYQENSTQAQAVLQEKIDQANSNSVKTVLEIELSELLLQQAKFDEAIELLSDLDPEISDEYLVQALVIRSKAHEANQNYTAALEDIVVADQTATASSDLNTQAQSYYLQQDRSRLTALQNPN